MRLLELSDLTKRIRSTAFSRETSTMTTSGWRCTVRICASIDVPAVPTTRSCSRALSVCARPSRYKRPATASTIVMREQTPLAVAIFVSLRSAVEGDLHYLPSNHSKNKCRFRDEQEFRCVFFDHM